MPTLNELRAAHEKTGAALREAEDSLGQARDRALTAVDVVADREREVITGEARPDMLAAAKAERTEAMDALAALQDALAPETPREDRA